jgi:hypothetical protein
MFFPIHSTRRRQCTPTSQSNQAQQLAKLNLSSISTKTIISFLIEIFLRLDALSNPLYAANAVHADFTIETSPATRKTQSFLDFDENCYFVPDGYISAFKRSFHSILHAKSSSCLSFGSCRACCDGEIGVHCVRRVEWIGKSVKTPQYLNAERNYSFRRNRGKI